MQNVNLKYYEIINYNILSIFVNLIINQRIRLIDGQ